jgi:uncharacterized protein
MAKSLEHKLEYLRRSIRRLDSALAACSGEVDNSFLIRICRQELGEKAVSLRALASFYPSGELSMARRVARIMGVRDNEQGYPASGTAAVSGRKPVPLQSLPKSIHTLSSLRSLAMRAMMERAMRKKAEGDGTQRKERSLVIFRQAGLQSPILESGVSKGEIRLLAKELGLPNWEQEARGGAKAAARKAETARRYLVSLGFRDVRLAVRGRGISICVGKNELLLLARRSEAIMKKMRSLGFSETLLKLP